MKNIIFIGGIHGVGKGTLCEKICNEFNLSHLSASEVLKWEEISEKENKLVKDFTLTQNRLITNLKQIVNENEKYILDGHYCLLNKENFPKKIDFDTFDFILYRFPVRLYLTFFFPSRIGNSTIEGRSILVKVNLQRGLVGDNFVPAPHNQWLKTPLAMGLKVR